MYHSHPCLGQPCSPWVWAHSCLPPAGRSAVLWLTSGGFSRGAPPRGLLTFQPTSLGSFSCWWRGESRSMQSPWCPGLAKASHRPTQIPRTGQRTLPPDQKVLRVSAEACNTGVEDYGGVLAASLTSLRNPQLASLDIMFPPGASLGGCPCCDPVLQLLSCCSPLRAQEGKRKTLPVSAGLYHLSTRTSNTSKPVLWPPGRRSKLPCPSALGQPSALLWLMRCANSKGWTCACALRLYYCAWVFAVRKTYSG